MRAEITTCSFSVWRQGVAIGLAMLCLSIPGQAKTKLHIFATEVREVRSSSVGNNNILTLEIDDITGPTACKSSTLLVHRSIAEHNTKEADFETIALHALLTSESVVLSVPTDFGHCVDGRPTVADMWLMSYE